MNRAAKIAISLFALGLIVLILLPRWAPVNAVSWAPPFNPGLTGEFATNQALSAIIEIPVGTAPEHVACDATEGFPGCGHGSRLTHTHPQDHWPASQ